MSSEFVPNHKMVRRLRLPERHGSAQALAGAVYQWTATRIFERRHPPRGELIDVGGHRLHIHRQGKGSPAVVIDAGLAGGSYEWDALAAEISAVTEVCTYDRAGYGWSDRGPTPRSSQQIVAELHTLLEKAQVKPPFILVGHSLGGLNVRLYASQHPDEVAGVVLVDAANHDVVPDDAPIGQASMLFHFLNGTAHETPACGRPAGRRSLRTIPAPGATSGVADPDEDCVGTFFTK